MSGGAHPSFARWPQASSDVQPGLRRADALPSQRPDGGCRNCFDLEDLPRVSGPHPVRTAGCTPPPAHHCGNAAALCLLAGPPAVTIPRRTLMVASYNRRLNLSRYSRPCRSRNFGSPISGPPEIRAFACAWLRCLQETAGTRRAACAWVQAASIEV